MYKDRDTTKIAYKELTDSVSHTSYGEYVKDEKLSSKRGGPNDR